jgi:hypothetical protein
MMSCEQQTTTPLGWWSPSGVPPKSDPARLREAIWNIRQAVTLVTEGEGSGGLLPDGRVCGAGAD